MQISKYTSKLSVGIIIFLMVASIAAISMPTAKAAVKVSLSVPTIYQ